MVYSHTYQDMNTKRHTALFNILLKVLISKKQGYELFELKYIYNVVSIN